MFCRDAEIMRQKQQKKAEAAAAGASGGGKKWIWLKKYARKYSDTKPRQTKSLFTCLPPLSKAPFINFYSFLYQISLMFQKLFTTDLLKLESSGEGYAAMNAAIEAAYNVGARVVDYITENWDSVKENIPSVKR